MALVKALALILNRFKRFEEEMGKEDAEPQEVQLSWAELSRATRLSRWCIHLFARRPANLCNSNKADSTYEICAVQGTKTRADLTLTYGTHWVLPGSKLRSKPLPAPTNHGSPLSRSRYQDPSDGKPSSESIWISQTTVEMFSDVAKCKWIWWTCFWHFLTASHFSSVHLAGTHVWTGNVTRFNVAMDASKSPMRFFTRARMKRKWGWFLTVYRTSRCSFYSNIKFISLVQKWKMVWPQRTPTTSGPNRFGLASPPETTKCIQMCCQNFQHFKPFRFGLFVLVQGDVGLCEQIPAAGLMMKSLQVAVFLDTGYRDIRIHMDSHKQVVHLLKPFWALPKRHTSAT